MHLLYMYEALSDHLVPLHSSAVCCFCSLKHYPEPYLGQSCNGVIYLQNVADRQATVQLSNGRSTGINCARLFCVSPQECRSLSVSAISMRVKVSLNWSVVMNCHACAAGHVCFAVELMGIRWWNSEVFTTEVVGIQFFWLTMIRWIIYHCI